MISGVLSAFSGLIWFVRQGSKDTWREHAAAGRNRANLGSDDDGFCSRKFRKVFSINCFDSSDLSDRLDEVLSHYGTAFYMSDRKVCYVRGRA